VKSFDDVKNQLRNASGARRLAVVAADEEHTLDAVVLAAKDGLISPLLLGKAYEIKEILEHLGCPESLVQIEEAADPEEAALRAAALVKEARVDCIMKGNIETGILMKVLVSRETGIRKRDTMSLLALVESPYYHKIFGITDVGLLTRPTLEQKKAVIQNGVDAFHSLGEERPKVAVLAAVEKPNLKMPETLEADTLKKMGEAGEIENCFVEGPISYDLAINREASKQKGYQSPVAGDADILVVPDITAGNILIKALSFTGGAKTAGVILGAMVPLVITSRSSPMEDKYMAILFSVLIGSYKDLWKR
jgi:phosphotransacetylase